MAVEGESHRVPRFTYSQSAVTRALAADSPSEPNQLERLLEERWVEAMSSGVFRYDLSDVVTRPVEGEYGFIIQSNPKRHTHRRAPARMTSLRQLYDPSLFNFNQVKEAEILSEICAVCDDEGGGTGRCGGDVACKHHIVVVNVSPITHGHCMLVPEPSSCLPQVLTEDSLRLCLDVMALSNSSGFTIVANSLLAHASVNHLHYHILKVEQPVLATRAEGRHIAGHVYALTSHPTPGFGFQLNASTKDCARAIFAVVDVLLEGDIPHNLVILKGTPFEPDKGPAQVVKTILIPRRPHHGGQGLPAVPPLLSAAACELAQGFIPVLDTSRFQTLTEQEILQILQEKSLSEKDFQLLLQDIKSIAHL